MKVLIVAGHGGTREDGKLLDNGACSPFGKEAEKTRTFCSKLATLVPNCELYDINKNLYEELRTNRFNPTKFRNYDYILEVHFNAFRPDIEGNRETMGTEILVSSYEKELTIAENIVNAVAKNGFKNRGIKFRNDLQNINIGYRNGVNYGMLEICFIDDKDDMEVYAERFSHILEDVAKALGYKGVRNVRYNKLYEIPAWGKTTIEKIINKGLLKGDDKGNLNLSEDMLRMFVVNDRGGLYDK